MKTIIEKIEMFLLDEGYKIVYNCRACSDRATCKQRPSSNKPPDDCPMGKEPTDKARRRNL